MQRSKASTSSASIVSPTLTRSPPGRSARASAAALPGPNVRRCDRSAQARRGPAWARRPVVRARALAASGGGVVGHEVRSARRPGRLPWGGRVSVDRRLRAGGGLERPVLGLLVADGALLFARARRGPLA